MSKQHWAEVEENSGLIVNPEKAKELISLYRDAGIVDYHLVQIIGGNDGKNQAGFLGYDVSNDVYNDSMLTPLCLRSWEKPGDGPWSRIPLFRLLGERFYPELNQNGLFSNYETALFYLQCNEELEKTYRMGSGDIFAVVGLIEQPLID